MLILYLHVDFFINRDEITVGAELLLQKIKMFRPKIVAFNGRGLHHTIFYILFLNRFHISDRIGIYEVYAGNKHFHYGKQPDTFPGTDTV